MDSLDSSLYSQYLQAHGHAPIAYGTAGFRTKAEQLPHVAYRLGQFVGLLVGAVQQQHPGSVLGIMITASHNPIHDNGFKVVNWQGEMLEEKYESLLTDYVNGLPEEMDQRREVLRQSLPGNGNVFMAMDNRPSSEYLHDLICQGIQSVGSTYLSFGHTTTPQLHLYVSLHNQEGLKETKEYPQIYRQRLIDKFSQLVEPSDEVLLVDGANGVGGTVLHNMIQFLPLQITVTEYQQPLRLNDCCGSEYVQKNRKASSNIMAQQQLLKCCAFDGDCDRLIYFGRDQGVHVVEGDKMMVLWLQAVRILMNGVSLKVGAVQTAYANGRSTQVIKQLGVEVSVEPTGVKYLHRKARHFDIGVYFESNGHGTILTKTDVLSTLQETHPKLFQFLSLANQQTGDGIANMLMTEAALQITSQSMSQFMSLFTDLPSQQVKVQVKNKYAIKTTYDETKVTSPPTLQVKVDHALSLFPGQAARAFIRPSGTEDIVRLYVEATTQSTVQQLVHQIQEHILNEPTLN